MSKSSIVSSLTSENTTLAPRTRGRIDNSEQDGDTDTIYKFGLRKIENKLIAAFLKPCFTFALDLFAGKLIQIVACVNDCLFRSASLAEFIVASPSTIEIPLFS
jgi:hypothetical protein